VAASKYEQDRVLLDGIGDEARLMMVLRLRYQPCGHP